MEKTAVIYIRVSTDEQRDQGFSLQDQEIRCVKYCKDNGIRVLEMFQDDYSAKDFNRPAFQKFIDLVEARKLKPNFLIVTKFDRFSRNMFDGYAMSHTLAKHGIKVFSLAEGTLDFSDPYKFFPNVVQSAAAQYENLLRADNTVRGMRQALKEGRWMWAAPKGYTRVNKMVVPHPVHADLVREAFREVSKGVRSCDEVRRSLVARGFECSKNQFNTLLRNRFYLGEIRIDAWKEEPETTVTGLHEPLVDAVTFKRVQNVMDGKFRRYSAKSNETDSIPLRGHLLCPACGGNLTGSGSRSRTGVKHYYYHCQKGCKQRFRAETANADFVDYLASFTVKDEILTLYYRVLEDVFSRNETERQITKDRIEQQIADVEARLGSLTLKFAEDHIDAESYRIAKKPLDEARQKLLDAKGEYVVTGSSLKQHLNTSFSLLRDLPAYYSNSTTEIKRQMVGSIFPEKLVYQERKYRTTSVNAFVSLFTLNANELQGLENRKSQQNAGLSCVAPPSGLEPETL